MADAAVIIIGAEILSGKFADENGPYLITRLRELGVDLGRIVVIPDDPRVIAEEVRNCSGRYRWVFSTGGVGPTHDDQTFPAIAAAFGVPVVRHPLLAGVIAEKFGDRVSDAAWRMAEVPEGAELWWDGNVLYPQVVMRNVVIFPGVPRLVRLKFEAVAHRFSGVPVSTRRLSTLREETEIAGTLSAAAERWPMVSIGSYPRFEENPHRVIVTMEGRDALSLEACSDWLLAHVAGATACGPG